MLSVRRLLALMVMPALIGLTTLTEARAGSPASGDGSSGAMPSSPYQQVHDGTLNYLLHLPTGYAGSTQAYPLLLFLHGIAQKGNGSAAALEQVADDGPFRTMRDGLWDDTLPLIVVGPQSGGLQPWWRGIEVRKVIEDVTRRFRIDPQRRYLTGISMGGRSAWWLATTHADEFAALVPASAWAGNLSGACDAFHHMGIWAFHGENDPVVAVDAGRKPIETLDACSPALIHPPAFTLLPAVGHGEWQRVYSGGHGGSNRGGDGRIYTDIYRWMLSFKR